MDEDLKRLKRKDLVEEVRRLRAGIRGHRDEAGHQLCWHHPQLWGLLPETSDPLPDVPEWPQFLRGCVAYRESLDVELPDAARIAAEATDGRRAPVTPRRALAVGATALGACAVGALAVGALAIGRLAIGNLALRQAHAGAIVIDDLTIGRLHVTSQDVQWPTPLGAKVTHES